MTGKSFSWCSQQHDAPIVLVLADVPFLWKVDDQVFQLFCILSLILICFNRGQKIFTDVTGDDFIVGIQSGSPDYPLLVVLVAFLSSFVDVSREMFKS